MTLIIGMSKADGIYLSVDCRVTDLRSGRLVDDAATKFLTVLYPPDQTGPRALFAYTGVAVLPDGTPTGRWIRESLRGETQMIDQSMDHLRQRLDRDIAPIQQPMIVNVLVLEPGRRLFGGFSNMKVDGSGRVEIIDFFGYTMKNWTVHFGSPMGVGRFGSQRRT